LRPVSVAAERPVAVVQGYSPDLSYGLLAEAAIAVRDGAWFVASNDDRTLPTSRGQAPGNGSLLQVVITATGRRPVVAGKPEPPLHAEAVARTGARRPLVIGDRLETDIEGAVKAGADSMLVLTGASTALDAVLAAPSRRPTYIAADLSALLEEQTPVTAAGPRWGGWEASASPLTLAGGGRWLDGLRALCAAAWSGEPVTHEAAESALGVLAGAEDQPVV
jgi:ribonucleotide monophosphatase NagD (HAD superfamily)